VILRDSRAALAAERFSFRSASLPVSDKNGAPQCFVPGPVCRGMLPDALSPDMAAPIM